MNDVPHAVRACEQGNERRVSLCLAAEVSMLSADESDAEVMQRFAPLSRSIQDFIAEFFGDILPNVCFLRTVV